MAGSSVTVTKVDFGHVKALQIAWVADDADGTVPATELPRISGELIKLQTNPGTPAPTANYDLTLPDGHGIDQLQGLGANRHTSTSEEVNLVVSGEMRPHVTTADALTFTLANNSVNSAEGVATLVYRGSST